MSERAKVGDKVRVWWENDGSIDGVIEYTPQDVGDSWVLIEDDGSIVHVNLFYGMRVLSRKVDIANAPADGRASRTVRPEVGKENGGDK